MKTVYPSYSIRYNLPYFTGKVKQPVSTTDNILRQDILAGKLFKNEIQSARLQDADKALIFSLLKGISQETSPTETEYIMHAATIYCLLHPTETNVLTQTLHVLKKNKPQHLHHALVFALVFAISPSVTSPSSRQALGGLPTSVNAITQLQQNFFGPLLDELYKITPKEKQSCQDKQNTPKHCTDLLNIYSAHYITSNYLNTFHHLNLEIQTPYADDLLKQLIPSSQQKQSCLSRLLTPRNMPESLRNGAYKKKLKPVLKQFHPELTKLLNGLAPEGGKAYLYKFYQNNYDEPLGPRFHPHLLLLQKLELQHPEGQLQSFIQVTYLDDERPFSPTESSLIWQPMAIDARSGHYLHIQSSWTNGKLERRDQLNSIVGDLLRAIFGKGPRIGTGPSVSIIDINEQDRNKVKRYELFGNPNVPDFIKTARHLAWHTASRRRFSF